MAYIPGKHDAIVKSNSTGSFWSVPLGGAFYPILDTLTNPLSVTIECSGGDVEIGLMADGLAAGYIAADDRDHIYATIDIQILRNGNVIGTLEMYNQNNIGIHELSTPPSAFRVIDTPPPGSHTYTVKMAQSGTSVANNSGVGNTLLYAKSR